MNINIVRIFEALKKEFGLIFVKFSLEVQVSCSKLIHPTLNGSLVDTAISIIHRKCLQLLKRVLKS